MLCLGLISAIYGQKYEITTHAGKSEITPAKQQQPSSTLKAGVRTPIRDKFIWTVFSQPIDADLKSKIEEAGGSVIGSLGKVGDGIGYTIKLGNNSQKITDILAESIHFVNFKQLTREDRTPQHLRKPVNVQTLIDSTKEIRVHFHEPLSKDQITLEFKGLYTKLLSELENSNKFVDILTTFSKIQSIAENTNVLEISSIPLKSTNTYDVLDFYQITEYQDVFGAYAQEPPTTTWLEFPLTGDWWYHNTFGQGITVDVNEPGSYRNLGFCEREVSTGKNLLREPGVRRDCNNTDWGWDRHGLNVAGIIGGNGWGSSTSGIANSWLNKHRGIAPKVQFIFNGLANVENHSFSQNYPDAVQNQIYKGVDRDYDISLSNHNTGYVGVFSAGNNAHQQTQPGLLQQGYYSLGNNSKNGIIVGATWRNFNYLYLSSAGPSRDGRIKPDIVAVGANITTADAEDLSNTNVIGSKYRTDFSATSAAGPVVSGVAALLLQQYEKNLRDENLKNGTNFNLINKPMWNSTVKGLLIHTAVDLVDEVGVSYTGTNSNLNNSDFRINGFQRSAVYGRGPDWTTGWGQINAQRALLGWNRNYVQSRLQSVATDRYFVKLFAGQKYRVTLVWDDPAPTGIHNSLNAYSSKLVNNLNVVLRNISTGAVYSPWILNHAPLHNGTIPADGIDRLITPALINTNRATRNAGGIDNINNVEVIDIDAAIAGDYEIVVSGQVAQDQSNLGDGKIYQDYSLISDEPFIFEKIPNRIEAEKFATAFEKTTGNAGTYECQNSNFPDVDISSTTDSYSSCAITNTAPGEWLEYKISPEHAGIYDLVFRLASAQTSKTITLKLNGISIGTLTAPSAGLNSFSDRILSNVSIPKGNHVLRVEFVTGDVAMNYINFKKSYTTLIPSKIEAEDFASSFEKTSGNLGNSGCQSINNPNVDITTTNDPKGGNCHVGWIDTGEWLEYKISSSNSQSYNVLLRLASGQTGKTVTVKLNGTSIGVINVPSSGWNNFEDRTLSNISIPSGIHTLRLEFVTGALNLNYLQISSANSTPPSGNLIKNGDFSGGMTNWSPAITSPANASFVIDNGQFKADIITDSPTNWHINLAQKNLTIKTGKTYKISFKGRAQSNRTIVVQFKRTSGTSLLWQTFNLTTSLQTFNTIFNSTGDFNDGELLFFLASQGIKDIWLDDVIVQE